MTSVGINNIAILIINSVGYHCTAFGISKNEAINLLKNSELSEKNGSL